MAVHTRVTSVVAVAACAVLTGLSGCAPLAARSARTPGAVAEPDGGFAAPVDQAVARAAGRYMGAPGRVGLSVGVLRGDAQATYHYGEVEAGTGRRPTARTLYEIGSVTKTVTGQLLARAALDGRLRLDADVRHHLARPYPNLAYQGAPVRVVHLANHTSGLPVHSVEIPPGAPPDTIVAREARNSDAAFLGRLQAVTLARAPGTAGGYSNAAFALAGVLLQQAYGAGPEGYEALVVDKAAGPLGMADTRVHLTPDQERRLARGYDAAGAPRPAVVMRVAAGGGLRSTTADLLRYALAHAAERDPAVRLSHEVTTGAGAAPGAGGIALGWAVGRDARERRRLSHGGGTLGYSAFVLVYPDQRTAVVCLANQAAMEGELERVAAEIASDVLASATAPTAIETSSWGR